MGRIVRFSDGLLLVGKPGIGVNVTDEPAGSDRLAFDSRITDFGIIHRQGVVAWAGNPTTVNFPTMAYVPLVSIHRVNSSGEVHTEEVYQFGPSGSSNTTHFYTPYVATVSQSQLQIHEFRNPYYAGSQSFPGGTFLYTIYNIRVAD